MLVFVSFLRVVYLNSVRSIRSVHRNAIISILYSILQNVIMVLVFVVFLKLIGAEGNAIRGDFLLYVMSGVFVFMTHIKSIGAVMNADGPSSPLMKHAPMNLAVTSCAASLSSIYIQTISVAVILLTYHSMTGLVYFDDPFGVVAVHLLAWVSGSFIGLCLLALKSWSPTVANLTNTTYSRVNMIASGKMFVANSLPKELFEIFSLNPLFHVIDRGRGYMFLNYNAANTSLVYPVYTALCILVLGVLLAAYANRHVSFSSGVAK